jgi:hypothetical protein
VVWGAEKQMDREMQERFARIDRSLKAVRVLDLYVCSCLTPAPVRGRDLHPHARRAACRPWCCCPAVLLLVLLTVRLQRHCWASTCARVYVRRL